MNYRYRKIIKEFIVVGVLIALAIILVPKIEDGINNKSDHVKASEDIENKDIQEKIEYTLADESLNLEINSQGAILVKRASNEIYFDKNSKNKMYPASLTKIMTSILAIENIDNLEKEIAIREDVFNELYAKNASMAGFQIGETVKAKDLLYGVLLPSGGEATLTLALEVSETEEEFVKLMNEKAREIGMNDTNFYNATGLHDDEHYTTAYDFSLLLNYALENDIFREVFTTQEYQTSPTNYNAGGIKLYSTILESNEDLNLINGEIIGSKTGYTDLAGLCLASLARINGDEYILINLGAPGNHYTEQFNVIDAKNIYNSVN